MRANGVLIDSVVVQINKVIQYGGIDLDTDAGGSFKVSLEDAAICITESAIEYHDAYSEVVASDLEAIRLEGFTLMIRGIIEKGFEEIFFSSITKMTDILRKTIELIIGYLSYFEAIKHSGVSAAGLTIPCRYMTDSSRTVILDAVSLQSSLARNLIKSVFGRSQQARIDLVTKLAKILWSMNLQSAAVVNGQVTQSTLSHKSNTF